jgi:hypothetical protein
MYEMTLTVQYTPQGLVRVGLGPERTVYLPIQDRNGTVRLNGHGEPVWSNEAAEVFIAAYPDHMDVTLAIRPPQGQDFGAIAQAGCSLLSIGGK